MFEDNPLRAEKRKKLHQLREKGINPFPYQFQRTGSLNLIHQEFQELTPGEKRLEAVHCLAGRLMTLRSMGKACFFNLQDQSGALQVYVKLEELSSEDRTAFDLVDLGDFVGVEGFVFRTQKGELSLHCKKFSILCKGLEPLPEKFHGIADIEIKYRHRHLDLISDPESRQVFEARSKIVREIRSFLDHRGFLEVETPILQPMYGGAAAQPFTTHHRALDMKLFMKISPELYLKRLIVGGFEKVYDMSKNFRNEGIDRSHNPEFMMLEWYESYTDYLYQLQQFQDLTCHLVMKLKGSYKFIYQGKEIDFTPPWRKLTVYDGLREYAKIEPKTIAASDLDNELAKHGSENAKKGILAKLSRGEKLMELFELTVEKHLWHPTFVMDHPVEISPLTKAHRTEPGLVERFEPFAAHMEIGNAYSELNDPEEQRLRLEQQEKKRQENQEAHPMDEDFMLAIDTGMPPTGGVGFGVERIVMILTDRPSIRDIILFPTMKLK